MTTFLPTYVIGYVIGVVTGIAMYEAYLQSRAARRARSAPVTVAVEDLRIGDVITSGHRITAIEPDWNEYQIEALNEDETERARWSIPPGVKISVRQPRPPSGLSGLSGSDTLEP